MLNKENFIKSVYEKSKHVNLEDDFYSTEVYKEEKKSKYKYCKLIVNFVFVFVILGTVGTIALTTYRTKYNKPNYNWSDGSVKFNEKYDDYSKSIGKIIGTHNGTELKLTSQNYDGGFVVLEFDLKLDKEDKKYLKIGENTFSSEEIEENRKNFNGLADERINNYNPNLTEEENNQRVEKWKNKKITYEKELEKMSLEKNTVKLLLNYDISDLYTYKIDGIKYHISDGEKQEVKKINDLEYKIFIMYFVPDEYIENKDHFVMSFENIILTATSDKDVLLELREDGIAFAEGRDDNETINLHSKFDVNIEKNDSEIKLFNFNEKNVKYDILTEKIEYVKVTPMQTIIKIKANMDGIKEDSLKTRWEDRNSPELIGNISFNVYNENNEVIGSSIIESRRYFWYENGDFEEWEKHGLVPNDEERSSNGGRLEITEYVIVSNDDYDSFLKIIPMITRVSDEEREYFKEIDDSFEINLN